VRGKVAIARAAGVLSRRAGRGGTSLPGKVLLRLDPGAIGTLAAGLSPRAVISATNGKTTTAAMVEAVVARGVGPVLRNRQGANMAGGIASAFLTERGQVGVFEVDEFWLPQLEPQLRPDAILLANLFRDQLDRFGELETIADRWAGVAAAATGRLVLNADDPLVADLGRVASGPARFFGIEDDGVALREMAHAADAKHCRTCGAPYRYDAVYLGHLGRFHCDSCGATRPTPEVRAHDVTLDGLRGASFTLRAPQGSARIALPLPGLYNVYNALGAAALALELGAGLDDVVAGLQDVAPAFGRAESVRIADRELLLLLVKNPAGANEVLRTLVLEDGEHDLLAVLNDRTADGRDVSWVWDFDLEVLAGRVRRVVCAGTRAAELALRFKYAGVAEERIVTVPALEAALDDALAGGTGRLVAIPTYTAMLELRELLARRSLVAGQFA
jgi:UDP-N-acetylmuramyl tripeptide synthase